MTEGLTMSNYVQFDGVKVAPDSLIIHVIPEPMTIALLGLGGLVALRRRR